MARKKTALLVGIDIGSSAIRAIACFRAPESPLPVPQLTLELPTEGVDKGRILDEKEVASLIERLLHQIEEELDERIVHVVVSYSPLSLHSVHLTGFTRTSRGDALVTDLDVQQAIKEGEAHVPDLRNKSIIHALPIKYKLDGQEASLPVVGLKANKIEVKTLYITCQKQLTETLRNTLSLAKIKIYDIVAGPLAASVPLLTKKERKSGVILVDIGASTTSLVVYENNAPLLVSTIPLGGNDITKDIAIGMKLTIEEAEEVKCGSSQIPHSKRRVEEIIEARIADICEKINKELDTVHRRELLPSGIVLTGQSTLIPKIDYMMRGELRLPVKFAGNTLTDFTHGNLQDEGFARAFGSLFFVHDISESEVIFEALQNTFNKIKRYFARFLP